MIPPNADRPFGRCVIIFRLVRKTSKPPIMWKKKIITEGKGRDRERREGRKRNHRTIPPFPGIGASSHFSAECNTISLFNKSQVRKRSGKSWPKFLLPTSSVCLLFPSSKNGMASSLGRPSVRGRKILPGYCEAEEMGSLKSLSPLLVRLT